MAKITSGASFGLTKPQTMAAQLLADGKTEDDVLLALYGTLDSKAKTQKRRILRKWMSDPKFAECYRAVVGQLAMPAYGKALYRITAQIDDSNPWVAQGAAREVLTRFGTAIMGSEDKEVVVRIEGAPVLGVPIDDDAAGDAT